jgi:Ring finger domain
MGHGFTEMNRFWFSACIVWLLFIFGTYQDYLHRSVWSALLILSVGLLPIMSVLISVARRKYRDSLRYQSSNTNPQPIPILTHNMIAAALLPPEPREPPHRNLLRNPSIDSLVTFVYQNDGQAQASDCVVCLGQFQQGQWVAKLQFCSHLFHHKCIDPWLRQHKTCPICRSKVDGKVAEESMV